MAQQDINIGAANAKAGDNLRLAFTKIQDNFTDLYQANANTIQSIIVVNQDNAVATLGGVIDSTKVYYLDGIIDMGNTSITVPQTGITIRGGSFILSGLTSAADGYTMFVSESLAIRSGGLLGFDYYISVTGAGSKVYEIYDYNGFNSFESQRVRYIDCTSLGDIYDYGQGFESGTVRLGGSPSLTLHGNWLGGYRITASGVRNLAATMTEPLFKAGSLFEMQSRFFSDMNVDLPTLASLFDFSPSNFPNASTLQLQSCEVTRDGAYNSEDTNLTPNILASDLPCMWKSNNGLPNTYVGGTAVIVLEAGTTITTTGVYYDFAGTWLGNDLQHFELVANGGLKHLGGTPRDFEVSLSMAIDGGANDELSIKFFKYDDSVAAEIPLDYTIQNRPVNNFQGGRDVAFFVNFLGVTLDKDDILYCRVANNTDATNVTIEGLSFFRVQER